MTKTITFNPATFATLTAALFAPANSVAAAMQKAEGPKQAWAAAAATGILAADCAFTMADVRASLVTAAVATLSKRKGEGIKTLTDVKALGGGYATVAGWFYDLQRAEKGGLLPLLLEGNSLTGLRRATEPTQAQASKGASKGASKATEAAPTPTLVAAKQPLNMAEMADQLEHDAKRLSAKQLRHPGLSADVARIIAAAATIAKRIEALPAIKAPVKLAKAA